jgi:5-hydroxyisourate hydrolase-like protein (transthyretin family)
MDMGNLGRNAALIFGIGLSLFIAACGSGGGTSTPPITTYGLTVNSANPASGVAIGVSPADKTGSANGTTSFTRTYDAGAAVTLTAPATAGGNNFSSWTGCTSANGATCTVTMSANATVTANYAAAAQNYTLTVNSTNPASGVMIDVNNPHSSSGHTSTTSFTETGPAGTLILTAPATASGNNFASWTGCTTVNGAVCTVELNGNSTVTANYTTPVTSTYVLTVNSANPASGVAIGVSPADNNGVANGSTSFTRTYNAATSVTLTAAATAGGNAFSSWTGCATTSTVTCHVTLNANTIVTANYAVAAHVLTVNSTNPASGVAITVSPADLNSAANGSTSFTRTYNAGTSISLNAPATAGGNNFSSWTGCTSTPLTNVCDVTLNADTTVTANYVTPTFVLTVNSTNPASGVAIGVSPADNNSAADGSTSFTRTYNAGVPITLTAPATSSGSNFGSWTGCTSNPLPAVCGLTLNANTTVTANYTTPAVAVLPNPASAVIGSQLQFTAKVNGTVSSAVTWSVAAPAGSSLSPGTISSTGLYTTPYPAPATVTVTATSTQNPANSGSVVVTLSQPAKTSGPALSVDTGNQTRAINPYIYGWNAYQLNTTAAKAANITVDRWGGDSTERYNYQLDVTSSMADWFFENQTGEGGDGWPHVSGVKAFDALVNSDTANGFKTVGTVPVLGWVAKDSTSCSFPKSTYPNQLAVNGKPAFSTDGRNCGSGVYPNGVGGCTNANGCNISANPNTTSVAEPPPAPPAPSAVNTAWADATWVGGWTQYLVNKFGTAANGGVAFYDLDNEPSWWDANDFDVHPLPFTYDEVTNGGIGTALAIKTVDPTAAVNGPVLDYWWSYFYSMKDIRNGWGNGNPCWQPWSNPVDREAHGGVPFIEYYLQNFKTAQSTYGVRLLDYLDLHTYFAASYNGSGLAFATAGDTGAQQARINSTRVFWDPAYTDPNLPQPNYITDANYTTSCSVPLQAPQVIPMMQKWIADDYPGTKTAITEYNWGGQEHINGALAQADLLGIFGAYGLDMATLWGPPDPSTQVPGLMAYEIYRNYDGSKSTFGDEALASTSADQGKLSVYGALRTADNKVTVMVINKTYGDLTSTLSLANLPATATSGQAYLYSNANLNAIVAQPAVTITPGSGGAASTIANYTFPAQSITLFVVPM